MYRGEVRVGREDLTGLMRAAESLQVRGLASSEPRPTSPPETPTTDLMGEASTPEGARPGTPEVDDNVSESTTPSRDIFPREQRLPHMSHLNFSLRELRDSCESPLMPRRKQARPRRRSGELVPQDLSRPHPPASLSPPSSSLNLSNNQHQQQTQQQHQSSSNQQEDIAENLSMKRSVSPPGGTEHNIKTESEGASSPRGSPLTSTSLQAEGSLADLPLTSLPTTSGLSLTPPHHQSEYLASLGQLAAQWLPNHSQSQLHGHHPRGDSPHNRNHLFQQGDSPMTPRRSVAIFPMDRVTPLGGAAGLFTHSGLDRGSLLPDLHDSFKPETLHGLFGGASMGHLPGKKPKKHRGDGEGPRRWSDQGRGLPIGRPKGQHSAPRGGPPRSWTNAELTEALQHVWNKKMTTSQASRIFGIPYNSLLMYVRGKYGKSLKLEQLKRDCTGATAGEVMNSLNNNNKAPVQPPQMSHLLPGMPHPGEDNSFPHHQLLGGNLSQGYFPDFPANYPIPVNMIHLLPPSEQKPFDQQNTSSGGNCSNSGASSERTTRSRSPSPMPPNHESIPQPPQSAPAVLQQNGAN